ncbi:MAG: hypothetical protein U1E51_27310 [Candidatus Binatia bacterium]|nr:hypothetical protein [Candidatus Binatia bacterium]
MATTITGLSEEELEDIAGHLKAIDSLADLLMVHADEMREALGILAPKEVKPARRLNPDAKCKVCEMPRGRHDDSVGNGGRAPHKFVLLRKQTPQMPVSASGMGLLGGTA